MTTRRRPESSACLRPPSAASRETRCDAYSTVLGTRPIAQSVGARGLTRSPPPTYPIPPVPGLYQVQLLRRVGVLPASVRRVRAAFLPASYLSLQLESARDNIPGAHACLLSPFPHRASTQLRERQLRSGGRQHDAGRGTGPPGLRKLRRLRQ